MLGDLVSAVADAIVVVDTEGVVRYGNPAAQELFARPREALVGVELGFPVAPGETSEIDLLLPDGSRAVVEMRVTETTWEGDAVYVASLRDIGPAGTSSASSSSRSSNATRSSRSPHTSYGAPAVILGMSEILRDGWGGLPEDRRLHLVELIAKQAHQLRRVRADPADAFADRGGHARGRARGLRHVGARPLEGARAGRQISATSGSSACPG